MKKIAVFPGSFDPITRGHQSVLLRALPLFDEIIVAVGSNAEKKNMFSSEQRIEWIKKCFRGEKKIQVSGYSGLTIDFCKDMEAKYMVRGLRTSADFEFERAIAHMNKSMMPEIETIFILTEPGLSAVTSTIVRDIIRNGGDAGPFIPEGISIR